MLQISSIEGIEVTIEMLIYLIETAFLNDNLQSGTVTLILVRYYNNNLSDI